MNGITGNGQFQRLALAALAIALALAAVGCGGAPEGRIAFESEEGDLNFKIYAVNADGSELTRLTNFDSGHPTWSPDRRRIAFVGEAPPEAVEQDQSEGSTSRGIYVMNVDGSGLTRIADASDWNAHPTWSPDGQRIAFQYEDGYWNICVVNADGSGLTSLTIGRYPEWSPDGERIAFYSSRSGNDEMHVMDADGSNVAQLTYDDATPRDSGPPSWSPDGRRIAFTSDRNDRDGQFQIYVMNVDGSDVVQLTNHPGGNVGPSWSPDGQRIAFISGRDRNAEIYVMNADGSGVTRLTNNSGYDRYPAWTR